jgi:hypothetical protein
MSFLSSFFSILFGGSKGRGNPAEPVEGRGLFAPSGVDFESSDSYADESTTDHALRDAYVEPELRVKTRDWKAHPSRRGHIDPVEGLGAFRETAGDFEDIGGSCEHSLPDRDIDPEIPKSRQRPRGNGIDPIPD